MSSLIDKGTIVERIDDLFLDNYPNPSEDLEKFYKEVLKIVINAEPQNKWISVKDRLPNRLFKDVLTYDGDGRICINWLEELVDDTFYFAYGKSITHWMPLPEPPEHETTTFKPITTDTRGYARQFSCSACDCVVVRTHYMRPDQFDYEYCPYCGRPVESEDDVE